MTNVGGSDGAGTTSGGAFGADGAHNYPHPFFSISDKYIPTTQKEMYRWAAFVFTTHPIFSRIIHKMAGYATTDLIFNCANQESEKLWKTMLNQTLNYKAFEESMLLDMFVYGNSFARFIYPRQRYLICPGCGVKYPIANIDYTFSGFRFRGSCKQCQYSGVLKAEDRPIRNRTKLKLVRVDPRYIQPIYEPITGATEYLYVVPKALANLIREGSNRKTKIRVILENVPLEVIEAVEKSFLVRFPADTIYHMKWKSISRDDNSLGDIPFLPVFKVIWLYYTLWRAQEAVSLEHILPWSFLTPVAGPGGQDPIMNVDMDVWNQWWRDTLTKFRRDPNHIALTPFPVEEIKLRGDAKALDNWQGLEHLKEVISAGMGVPSSFLFGGSNFSGGSVELRVLENEFRNTVSQLDAMLRDFVTPKISRYFSFPKDDIHHENFKMADDVQQRQMMIAMQQQGSISTKLLTTEFGFDYEEEQKRIESELIERSKIQRSIQLADAEVQAEMQKIMAKGKWAANQILQSGKDPEDDEAKGEGQRQNEDAEFGNQGSTFTASPMAIRMAAQNFMKTRIPAQREIELQQIRATNPEYARAIEQIIAESSKLVADATQSKPGGPGAKVAPPRLGPARAAI